MAFNRDDLPLVAKVADLAHTYIFGLVQNAPRFEDRTGQGPTKGCVGAPALFRDQHRLQHERLPGHQRVRQKGGPASK